jgi:hypothetical protein
MVIILRSSNITNIRIQESNYVSAGSILEGPVLYRGLISATWSPLPLCHEFRTVQSIAQRQELRTSRLSRKVVRTSIVMSYSKQKPLLQCLQLAPKSVAEIKSPHHPKDIHLTYQSPPIPLLQHCHTRRRQLDDENHNPVRRCELQWCTKPAKPLTRRNDSR